MANRNKGHNVAAKSKAPATEQNQPVSGADENNINPADAPKGPDNNKRLAHLEAQHRMLADFFAMAPDSYKLTEGEDPIDGVLRVIGNQGATIRSLLEKEGPATPGELAAIKRAEEAEAALASGRDQIDRLTLFLTERPGFEAKEGGELTDAAIIRVIEELDEYSTKPLGALVYFVATNELRVGDRVFRPVDFEAKQFTVMDVLEAAAAAAQDAPARGDDLPFDLPPQSGAEELRDLRDGLAEQPATFADFSPCVPVELLFSDGSAILPRRREIDRAQLKVTGSRVIFDAPIDFAPDGEPAKVTEAWLVAGGAAVRCEIAGGLRVGGGAQASIPAGHLIF